MRDKAEAKNTSLHTEAFPLHYSLYQDTHSTAWPLTQAKRNVFTPSSTGKLTLMLPVRVN